MRSVSYRRKVGELVLPRIYYNIILSPVRRSPKLSVPFTSSDKDIVHTFRLPHVYYMPHKIPDNF
jgi:hypothetical protein